MTLLTIARDAADAIGINRPTTVFGNTAPDAQKMLRMINMVGKKLVRIAPWQDLRKEQTFTATAGSEQTSAIPTDFGRFIPETFWNRTDIFLVSGPVTATEWQGMKANNYNDEARKFAYRNRKVYVVPDFDGGESLAFEYVSNWWIDTAADNIGDAAAWTADTNASVLDEELITLGVIYEFRKAEKMSTVEERQDFLEALRDAVRNDQPSARILVAGDIWGGGRHFTGAPPVNGDSSVL